MNELTLIVDGNWLLMGSMYVHSSHFKVSNSDKAKENGVAKLCQHMYDQTMMTYNILGCDNVVVVSDGGSWRKTLEKPTFHEEDYKGNRSKETELDWTYIYKAMDQYKAMMSDNGFLTCFEYQVEGDDWVWYWTNYLHKQGINCIIWTSDQDLQQLIRSGDAVVAWYNNKKLVLDDSLNPSQDILTALMSPIYVVPCIDRIRTTKEYIKPAEIVIGKILNGDSGDNIMSIIRYKKGDRTYKLSSSDIKAMRSSIELNSFESCVENKERIADYITEHKKFKDYGFSKDDIMAMIEYNTKLVWLDKSSYPDDIIKKLAPYYKQYKVGTFGPQDLLDFL